MQRLKSFYRRLQALPHWRWLRWLYCGGIVLIVSVIIASLMNVMVMPLVTRHGSEYPTPDITGKSLREAEAILNAADLLIAIESRQHTPDRPEGVVLDQYPSAGVMVKTGRKVKVIISAGARLTTVPYLRGYTPRQSQFMLDEAGLILGGESFTWNDSLPPGVVVSSIPLGGGMVPSGTVVNIFINEADDTELITVPILVGENIKTAETELTARGLILGAVFREVDSVLLPGTVVDQSAMAGEQVRRGTAIDLTITTDEY